MERNVIAGGLAGPAYDIPDFPAEECETSPILSWSIVSVRHWATPNYEPASWGLHTPTFDATISPCPGVYTTSIRPLLPYPGQFNLANHLRCPQIPPIPVLLL